MSGSNRLSPSQAVAAQHTGSHARLLAGPGTGKTHVLTQRVVHLIRHEDVSPCQVLVLTFTRAAAAELRGRVREELGDSDLPDVANLHAYALRVLAANKERLSPGLPVPVRVADDAEEEHIIRKDIARRLGKGKGVKHVKEQFQALATGWATLKEDGSASEIQRDTDFLGHWHDHWRAYGYIMRAELVYRLNCALTEAPIRLHPSPSHILVDEYQDLNVCDLAVIDAIVEMCDAELYVAGDDDQSIYGFRHAHPAGIRNFDTTYPEAVTISLHECYRCDPKILDLAQFVIEQDTQRVDKELCAMPGRDQGIVVGLRCGTEETEARQIADLVGKLCQQRGYEPHDILILLRSDSQARYSSVIRAELEGVGVPVAGAADADTKETRAFLAMLKLIANPNDDLAWRALLIDLDLGIGVATVDEVCRAALEHGCRFHEQLAAIVDGTRLIERMSKRLCNAARAISSLLAEFVDDNATLDVMARAELVAARLIGEVVDREAALLPLRNAAENDPQTSIAGLLGAAATRRDEEPAVEVGKVNILTMHKAKGLTAKAVFIPACEDEHIPGGRKGLAEADERRLFYVSLTRAKHHLYISHCDERSGQQAHSGRKAGHARPGGRTRTRFLQHADIATRFVG